MSKDCDVEGTKHSQIVQSATIGKTSWLEAGAVLSMKFIENLIHQLPNLSRLELYSASAMTEIFDVITKSGRNFREIIIYAIDGNFIGSVNNLGF
jgi:hypothetical protein